MSTESAVRHRVLIVSPSFHGYWRCIQDAFDRRGHDTSVVLYDDYATMLDKIRLKATVELPERLPIPALREQRRQAEIRRLTNRVLRSIDGFRPDRVVVIKGDGLDERFWDALGNTPRVLWLYDDLHRHNYSIDMLRQIGPVVHYTRGETEMLQSKGVDAHFLPLAFDPHRVQPSSHRSGEIVFIGSGYANRRETLVELGRRGLPVHAWGRDFSRHWYDRARTFSWSRPPIKGSREVSLDEAYRINGEGAAAVTIHGSQEGMAMRTFEVPGMAGVQLVDRDQVAEFYEIGTEVAVWHSVDELADLAQRALTDTAWAEGIREAGRKRTLAEHTFDHRVAEVDALWA